MDEDYRFDDFNDGSEKLVGEHLLAKLNDFVSKYGTQLHDIEIALDETLSEVWDAMVDPVALQATPYEQTNVIQLVRTDNKLFNKVMMVFSTLCLEMKHLVETAKGKFYAPLKLFGCVVGGAVNADDGDTQVEFGKMLTLLLDLGTFIDRCYAVTKNVVHQLSSLYSANQKLYQTSFKTVHLDTVYETLGELFTVLITLDEIIFKNDAWNTGIKMYKGMGKVIKSNPSRYGVEEEQLWQIEKTLFSIKGQLLDGRIYLNCVEQDFDDPGVLEVGSNKELRKEFHTVMRNMFNTLSTKITAEDDSQNKYKFMGFTSVYVFYILLFKDVSDKKFFKLVWDMNKSVPILHLYGDSCWVLPEFLRNTVPSAVKLLGNPDVTSFNQNYMKDLDRDFQMRVKNIYLQISIWMVRMESNLTNRADIQNILKTRAYLLSQGLRLASNAANLFKETVYLRLHMGAPLKTSFVSFLCQCVELIKGIQITFHRRSAMIGESISFMIQQMSYNLQKCLMPIKARLESGKKYTDAKLDVLAAVTLAMQMLNGCATEERRSILKLTIQMVFQMEFLKEEEIEDIKSQIYKLDAICDLHRSLKEVSDCSFLYWSRAMLPIYFNDLYQHPEQAQKLQYMFAALRDIIPLFKQAVHVEPKTFLDSYKTEIDGALRTHIIDPLCRDIETDLRLHIHSHLAVSERNLLKTGVKDFARFLRIRPLRFFDRTINIKAHVTHYLDTTFYNLTTVALNDWKTYGEMRNLAEEKYGLRLTEVHLPGQTLEQGIDVLEIMRNIHIFVARYNYNLNNQTFLEKTSENKTLNVINIGHISNSIRTHGVGIMNTTVNIIYQFLKQKFVIFSQFLFDDHIKSRLFRDIRYFKENKDQLDNKYPFERAQKFNKEIRKLGLTDQKQSYLDQFRNLITEIGNAMGFIRMIRSGGFNYVSNAIKFVPDLQDIVQFEELVTKANLSPETAQAAKNLDGAIDSLAKNFAEGTEYFQMLVDVFAEEFRNPQNLHLKNFFIIIPPLTINFVDHVLMGKDKLAKRKAGGFFTEDGFPMGVAYILKLLDQFKQFDSLHWFEGVNNHYVEEQQKVQAQVNKQKKEEQQTAVLTQKKLRSYQTEFELLHYSLSGGSIFFKD